MDPAGCAGTLDTRSGSTLLGGAAAGSASLRGSPDHRFRQLEESSFRDYVENVSRAVEKHRK